MYKRVRGIVSSIALVGVLTFSGINLVQAHSAEVINAVNDTKDDFNKILESAKDLKISNEEKEFYDAIYKSFKDYANKKGLKLTDNKIKESVNLLILLNDETFINKVFYTGLNYLGLDIDSYLEIMTPVFGEILDSEKQFYKLVLNTFSFDPKNLKMEDKEKYDSLKNNVTSFLKTLGEEYDEEEYDIVASMIWNLVNSDVKLSKDLVSYVTVYLEVDTDEFLKLVKPFEDKFKKYIDKEDIWVKHVINYFNDVLDNNINNNNLEELATKLYDGNLSFEKFSMYIVKTDSIYKNKSVDEIVNMLYKALLLREADQGGLSFWKNKYNEIISSGKTNIDAFKMIADNIISGEEFKSIDVLSKLSSM